MAIEIVDFPSYKMVIFHSKMLVHQRVLNLSFFFLADSEALPIPTHMEDHRRFVLPGLPTSLRSLTSADHLVFETQGYPLVNVYIAMDNHHF